MLKSGIALNGYKYVNLCNNNYVKRIQIGRLILLAFGSSCPEGKEASHLDGNPLNNELKNLAWETHSENMQRKREHGTMARGEKNGNSLLKDKEVIRIKKLLKESNLTLQRIAKMFNTTKQTIWKIKHNLIWEHL